MLLEKCIDSAKGNTISQNRFFLWTRSSSSKEKGGESNFVPVFVVSPEIRFQEIY
jgi:hypothetical protein